VSQPARKVLKDFVSNIISKPALVFDIETIPDVEKIETYYTSEELSEKETLYEVSLGFHQVVSFAFVEIRYNPNIKNFEKSEPKLIFNPDDELDVLLKASEVINKYEYFITFNGSRYDFPVLERRALFHGLQKSYENENQRLLLKELVLKSSENQWAHWKHLDIFNLLNLKGQKGGLSLLLDYMGLQKHNNLQGKEVYNLHKQRDYETLKQYAIKDADLEATLFIELVNFLRS
jgi:predicted PolB exonuclease-like 3'-5' exonuclease